MDRDNRIKWQKSGYDDDDNDDYGDEKAQQRAAEFLKWNQKMASRSQWGKKRRLLPSGLNVNFLLAGAEAQ